MAGKQGNQNTTKSSDFGQRLISTMQDFVKWGGGDGGESDRLFKFVIIKKEIYVTKTTGRIIP